MLQDHVGAAPPPFLRRRLHTRGSRLRLACFHFIVHHRSAPPNTARRRELRYANLPIDLRPERPLRGGSPATSRERAGLADIKVCNICCTEDVRVFILRFASRSRYRISSRWIEKTLPVSCALIKLAEDHLMPVDPGCSPPRCLNPKSPVCPRLSITHPREAQGMDMLQARPAGLITISYTLIRAKGVRDRAVRFWTAAPADRFRIALTPRVLLYMASARRTAAAIPSLPAGPPCLSQPPSSSTQPPASQASYVMNV